MKSPTAFPIQTATMKSMEGYIADIDRAMKIEDDLHRFHALADIWSQVDAAATALNTLKSATNHLQAEILRSWLD